MSDQRAWTFVPEVKTGEQFGQPINASKWFIASKMPTQDFIDKACGTLYELLSVMESLGVNLAEDSEWGGCRILFNDGGFNLSYSYSGSAPYEPKEIVVENSQGYAAGKIVKETDNA